MPTYTWACVHCQTRQAAFLSIKDYSEHPPTFVHCGVRMERTLDRPNLAVTSEASYKDLRATDGTDISTRAKHRAYMKAKNLTTVDDFKETWAKMQRDRQAMAMGNDPTRAADVAQAIERLGG